MIERVTADNDTGEPRRPDTVSTDIDTMLWSMRLQRLPRFFHQRFWEDESMAAEQAIRLEEAVPLESVAEHSWHVADTVLLIGPRFEGVDVAHAVVLAVLHDKMEITTGDKSPIGRDGTGRMTHAFNPEMRREKDHEERLAIESYVRRLSANARQLQESALSELAECRTPEARLVKAADKLQALAYVLVKKRGRFADEHLRFTLEYTQLATRFFPDIDGHYRELRRRLLVGIASHRGVSVPALERMAERN